ncbi:hypothetical protein VHEMI01117 [[Torrubiella] hemipterigena]|uniref:GDP/GTP exchange factor Sec2 N-terminal domain-containing protein n=1 Tax=[Torrubiella] hemipterigena TaxID=1531966 RepID=A0A0A1SS83_9HYPO|nr:hypothetical protein VHEMI01117 [[Torrubiella] hemipterigena]
MVYTMAQAQPHTQMATCCPGCGYDLPPPLPEKSSSYADKDLAAAQARIVELEQQVRQLNEKASEAVSRWADYEAELAKLKGSHPSVISPPASAHSAVSPPADPSPTRSSFLPSTASLSSLLYRKSTPNLRATNKPPALKTTTLAPMPAPGLPATPATGVSMAEDLLEALGREQTLRQEAEGRLSATSKEMEELSAALFEQANEMVADERRARAKLEERVDELERRDWEKRQRLERLENAMNRIERVKNILRDDNISQFSTPAQTPAKQPAGLGIGRA